MSISEYDYFIEYNIGQQLSSMFNFVADNDTLHALLPNGTYQHALDVLRMFRNIGVTDEDLLTCKVNVVYHKVLEKLNQYNFSIKYRILHLSCLPNYLKTLNIKVHYNLLPVRAKFVQYGLDNDSQCKFCRLGFESITHIFAKCNRLKIVWDFFDETMALLNINFSFL